MTAARMNGDDAADPAASAVAPNTAANTAGKRVSASGAASHNARIRETLPRRLQSQESAQLLRAHWRTVAQATRASITDSSVARNSSMTASIFAILCFVSLAPKLITHCWNL